MRTLEQMKDTAQRQLDGMTTNRDQMAKDVLFLADTVKRLEELVKQRPSDAGRGGFADAFDKIFSARGAA